MCALNGVPPDTELAREYDLAIDSQFVALGVYSLEMDYTEVDVQVNGGEYHEGIYSPNPLGNGNFDFDDSGYCTAFLLHASFGGGIIPLCTPTRHLDLMFLFVAYHRFGSGANSGGQQFHGSTGVHLGTD